jgi:transcriptional regulator with XRE-family HTH domain
MPSRKIPPLAENLRRLRKAKGWSQQKLAQEGGLSFTVVTKVEQGATTDPAISSLVKIAGALGVTLDELVGWNPSKK